MPDDPTLGELGRRLDDRFTELRSDLGGLARLIDGKVDDRIYQIQHTALVDEVKALKELRRQDAARLVATRRWLIGAVVVPLVAVLLPLLITTMGGHG